MFSKLSTNEIKNFIPFFESKPKFALFANAAKFQVEETLPNHPCDFYHLESNKAKYFYVFRHDNLSNKSRPILMIGSHGEVQNDDVSLGLEKIKLVEPNLENIEMLLATSDVSGAARKFFIKYYDREKYNNPCYNFYIPQCFENQIKDKLEEVTLPDNFSIGSTILSDAETLNNTWKFGSSEMLLEIREVLQRLPTVCIYNENKPIAFEMVGLHGQLNHQYTFPEFRNQGLGSIVECTIVSKCLKEGIQVVKSVEATNEEVVKRSSNHPLWRVVKDENEEPLIFDYTHYH
ncbi:unnamed protein product [Caenorhabditis brenneri]